MSRITPAQQLIKAINDSLYMVQFAEAANVHRTCERFLRIDMVEAHEGMRLPAHLASNYNGETNPEVPLALMLVLAETDRDACCNDIRRELRERFRTHGMIERVAKRFPVMTPQRAMRAYCSLSPGAN